jgi:hypothetical protein
MQWMSVPVCRPRSTELENSSRGAIHEASLRTTSFALRLTGIFFGPCTAWPEAVGSVIVVVWRKTTGRNASTDFRRFEMKTQIGRITAAVVKSGSSCEIRAPMH